MSISTEGMDPVSAMAIIGCLGVGAQLLAWRLRIPAIVLMLGIGVLAGPVFGVLNPKNDIGDLAGPMISIAVAIILFEGGLTLNFHTLQDATKGVMRLVFIGAPLGWLMSTLALRYGAGLGWEASAVFGGIMIVTGPTVIAPLLRQARLARRPAALLQWEAIINDPIGALAAVLAFEIVMVTNLETSFDHAMIQLIQGVMLASFFGVVAGKAIVWAFRGGFVPEYIKVPLLFVVLLGVFALSNHFLHESGLLAVTVMGVIIANADLPSYEELRRFKEHATVLLVSGVFILLAASVDFSSLAKLDWHAAVFVLAVVLVARPVTVLISLIGTNLPSNERWLIALTGPRGVVLVAVAGLFGERLGDIGIPDADLIGPLAFVLVAVTVVLHGFTLKPVAEFFGLSGGNRPGVLIVGGSAWGTDLAETFVAADVPVLMSDWNWSHLRDARAAGVPTFFGDILSEAAEQRVELVSYSRLIALTDNDAYNTLVTTDLGPEFGRNNVFQLARQKDGASRYALPASLGGRTFGQGIGYEEFARKHREGWEFRVSKMTDEFTFEQWRETRPSSVVVAVVHTNGELRFPDKDSVFKVNSGARIIHFSPALTPNKAETAADQLA